MVLCVLQITLINLYTGALYTHSLNRRLSVCQFLSVSLFSPPLHSLSTLSPLSTPLSRLSVLPCLALSVSLSLPTSMSYYTKVHVYSTLSYSILYLL
jgi:hypothetical protein